MPNIKISDLAPIALPAVGADTFFEVQTVAAGEDVSRKISLDEIVSTTGLDASFITVSANAQLPNERVLTAGTGIAITDGGPNSTIVVEATSGGLSGLGVWRFRTETTSPPGSGQIRFNNADPELATELFIAETNDGGTDVEAFLNLLDDGSLIYIQEQANSDNFIIVEVDTNTDSGTFRTIGIQAVVQQGASISQNTRVIVVINVAGGTIPDPLLLSNGSAGAPTYSYAADPDTGVFRFNTNTLGFTVGGTTQFVINPGSLSAVVADGPLLRNLASSSTVPNIVISSSDVNTGLGRAAADQLSLIAGGVEIARATEAAGANQFAIAQSGNSSVPELTSLADADTGFRWPANNQTVWIGGGSRAWNFSTAKFFSQFSNGPALLNEISSDTNPTVVADHADPDTGIGSSGNDEMSLIAGGVEAIRIDEVAGNVFITYFGPIIVPTASAGAASVGFDGDPDTGYFSPVDDAIAITAGGIEAQRWAELSGQVIQTNSNQVGLTASVTQTQAGGLALLSSYNEIATVGTTGDALTAFAVVAGTRLIVINNGANSLQLFPAVGDDIGAGVDTAITIAAGELGIFIGRDATNWDTLYNGPSTPSGGIPGTTLNSTLRFDGANFVENTLVLMTALGELETNNLDSLGNSFINIGGMDESDPGLNLEDGMSLRFEDRAQTNDFFIQNQGVGAVGPILYLDGPSTGIFTIGDGLGFRIEDAGNTDFMQMFHDGLHINMGGVNTDALRIEYPILMDEQAAAAADLAGYGQFWVRDDVPNTAMFTNDAGVDKSLVNDAVQARRTTGFILTGAFVDVTMDTTDIETDVAVLDHDLVTNTDNIIIGQPGTYEVTYDFDVITNETSGDPIIDMGCRVRLNDAGTGIAGSLANPYVFRDGSVGGADGQVQVHVSNTFIFTAAAADFITLQLDQTDLSGTGEFEVFKICMKVRRLL